MPPGPCVRPPRRRRCRSPSATRPATRAWSAWSRWPRASIRATTRSAASSTVRSTTPSIATRTSCRPGLPRPVTPVTLSRSENSTDVPSASPRARPISAPLARSSAASDPIRSLRSTPCRTRPRTRLVHTVRCGYPARRSPSLYAHTRQAVTRVGAAIRARLESSRAEVRIEGIYAFGSRVRGDHRGESDLDLLVVVGERGPEVVRAVVDSCVDVRFAKAREALDDARANLAEERLNTAAMPSMRRKRCRKPCPW